MISRLEFRSLIMIATFASTVLPSFANEPLIVSRIPDRRILSLQSLATAVIPVGAWTGHFEAQTLNPAWMGMRTQFFQTYGLLEGESASPLAPSPFNFLEL